ncbi:L,D-transpeptidase [Caldichromatium japonicum]|uniref:L,D-transpeptidase n=1 Tax=Caldichromatium japonicum TaxID=2699430 RepID=A0A6G7VDG3_9GAMM|nr:L,D-transpeptidase [Caldichromatium japonicum]QIK37925.1 L,D-transpeptidase [Caldichromatium japonicum]
MNPTDRVLGWTFVALYLTACAHAPARPEPEEARETRWQIGQYIEESSTTQMPAAHPEPGPSGIKQRQLVISLAQQRFVYREDGTLVRSGPVSSGAPGHSTPKGRFRVLSKDPEKVSSRYTNQLGMPAWMPYAIQFHGHYFLHEGWLPGHPDSHGCVRLHEADARFLFERLQPGDPILIRD